MQPQPKPQQRRRRRLAAAVLHLVVGGWFSTSPAGAAVAPDPDDDADDVVVDVYLAVEGRGSGGGASPRAAATAALVAAGVDVAVLDPAQAMPASPETAEALLRDALAACRAAGTLKVLVPPASPLAPDRIRAIGESFGFQFAGVRPDRSVALYRDLYARAR